MPASALPVDGQPAEVAGLPRSDPSSGASPATTPPAATPPGRSLSIAGKRYPVVLPKLRDARLHVAFVTISLHVLGQVGLHFRVSVPQILASILTCAVLDVVLTFRASRAIVWPASAMLTGSGVALILRVPTTPVGDHWTFHAWYVFAGVAALSLLTKYVMRAGGTPVFNPSNVGLVLAFVVLGTSRVEPLDFWWAPLNGWMILAYLLIVVGGMAISGRLHLLAGAAAFWLTLAGGIAVLAYSGHCMTARWAFAPVCGFEFWRAIVTSPEVLIFTFFMITDPKTVPRGRVSHPVFCMSVAVVCVLLMAPQTTEYWTKVGLLAGLTVMCVLRPLLTRFLPEVGSVGDRVTPFAARLLVGARPSPGFARRVGRVGLVGVVAAVVTGAVIVVGIPARGEPSPAAADVLGRVPHEVNPATMPSITVAQDVLDWNHEISGAGARAVVLTLVENLELENQGLLRADAQVLEAVDHGDRLDQMRGRLRDATASGTTVLRRFRIDSVKVTLLVPFGKQDGLSLGLESRGSVTVETYGPGRHLRSRSVEPFATTFVMRRATGARWLNVAELALESS